MSMKKTYGMIQFRWKQTMTTCDISQDRHPQLSPNTLRPINVVPRQTAIFSSIEDSESESGDLCRDTRCWQLSLHP